MHESLCKRQRREPERQEGLITNKKWMKTRSVTHLLKYSMLLQLSNIRKQDDLDVKVAKKVQVLASHEVS